MKIVGFFSLLCFFSSCGSGQSSIDYNKTNFEDFVIQYEANTRGFYQKLTVQKHTISASEDRKGIEKPIVQKVSDSDWSLLIVEVKKIDLDNLQNLVAPTEKRFYDGAAIANLKITYKSKIYETKSFDHGIPPLEIQKVVEMVNALYKAER